MTFASIDNQSFLITLSTDGSNMVVLNSGGRYFTLGSRTNPADPSANPDIYFVPLRRATH